MRRTERQRGFGDWYGFMLMAQGSGEVMVEHGVHAWDIAAVGSQIVEEAGGRYTDWDGVDSSLAPAGRDRQQRRAAARRGPGDLERVMLRSRRTGDVSRRRERRCRWRFPPGLTSPARLERLDEDHDDDTTPRPSSGTGGRDVHLRLLDQTRNLPTEVVFRDCRTLEEVRAPSAELAVPRCAGDRRQRRPTAWHSARKDRHAPGFEARHRSGLHSSRPTAVNLVTLGVLDRTGEDRLRARDAGPVAPRRGPRH